MRMANRIFHSLRRSINGQLPFLAPEYLELTGEVVRLEDGERSGECSAPTGGYGNWFWKFQYSNCSVSMGANVVRLLELLCNWDDV